MDAYSKRSGLNLKEVILALVVLVGLWIVLFPSEVRVRGKCGPLYRELSHQKSLVLGFQVYAMDYEGHFPHCDSGGTPFTTSTAVFRHSMKEIGISAESVFWTIGNPEKPRLNNDGILQPEENCLSYVTNQTTSTLGSSPLITQEMSGPGNFGEHHPFLHGRKAVVGYVDGHAAIETLSSRRPGATIPGPPDSGIDNIFEPAVYDEEGNWTGGGYLAVPTENILHP